MRGGSIYVQGDAGYRAGIHMKAYRDKVPVLAVGGRAGSFLGEYQAGGYIVVLGLGGDGAPPVGRFCAAGCTGERSSCAAPARPGTCRPGGVFPGRAAGPGGDCPYFKGVLRLL